MAHSGALERGVAAALAGGAAANRARRRELRTMTDDEARAAAEVLLQLVEELPPKTSVSGLLEQQRLFSRLRE